MNDIPLQNPRSFDRKVDVPGVVGQFLASANLEDLIVELVQNEIDANSTLTTISFQADRLICEGDGDPVDEVGWGRLQQVLGAGGDVPAKEDGIGAKNHGLRTGFWLGDEITVQSAGYRSDLALYVDRRRRVFDPGTWSREADTTAPQGRGVRITIPFRRRSLAVPSGERFELPPPSLEVLRSLYDEAVRAAPQRLISAILPGRTYRLELVWQNAERRSFEFECGLARVRGWPGLLRRTCYERLDREESRLLVREAAAEFAITLARNDRGKVPRPFRRRGGIVGEISWRTSADGSPQPSEGKLRYPIEYPDGAADAFSGHGFHISAPFVSDTARHGLASSAERNPRLVLLARRAMAAVMKAQLIPRHGSRVLSLARSPLRPDVAAEAALAEELLASNALQVRSKSERGQLGDLRFARGSEPLTAVCHSDTANEIAPSLFKLAPEGQLLAAGTPSFVVESLLKVSPSRVSLWTDLDAIETLLAPADDPRRAADALLATAAEVRSILERLKLVQRALNRETLADRVVESLKQSLLLPAADRRWTSWKELYFSREAPPTIAGLGTPATIHPKLTELGLLQEGPLRRQKFRMDDHLAKADLSGLPANSKEAFFAWLASHHSLLSATTLTALAEQPIWPSEEGGFAALDDFVAPSSEELRRILRGVTPYPREDLSSFPGLRKTQRGALYVRPWPEEYELEAWFERRRETIESLELEDNPAAVASTLSLEDDLNLLLSMPRIAEHVPRIAVGHQTHNGQGVLCPVAQLHLPSPAVQGCELLPDDLAGGPHHHLYALLGAHSRPQPGAVLAALQRDPRSGETLFRRLQAFADLSEPSTLEDLRVIRIGDDVFRPSDLSLPHPQHADLWGEWKRAWAPAHLTPDRTRLLVSCGVARFLTEALSLAFFQWLATRPAEVRVRHLAHAVRHLRDRQRGPFKWWESHPSVNCLPVRGGNGLKDYVSHGRAVGARSQVYLPDFPEAHELVLAADPLKRLAITDVDGVSGTLFTALREAGVRSLRREFGRPLTLTGFGEAVPGSAQLEAVLRLLRSDRLQDDLPKRLELHGVPQDHLRPGWRNYLRTLFGVRMAKGLRATFLFGSRTYEVPFAAGVDPSTGMVWLDGSRAPHVQLYEAIGVHLFTEEADPLSAYALMRAVEMPFESAAQAPEGTSQSESEDDADAARPEPSPRSERGHGVSPSDFKPAVPNPKPFTPLPPNRPQFPRSRRPSPPRAPASTDHLRGSLEELEQIREMKEDHYGWHCQACLGAYEVREAAPPGSYVALTKYRRDILHAHHVQHLQNDGALGAANLLALCHFHHDLLGDQLSPDMVRDALAQASEALRQFPRESGPPKELQGKIATIKLDREPFMARLFFTPEHASFWLGEAKPGESATAES